MNAADQVARLANITIDRYEKRVETLEAQREDLLAGGAALRAKYDELWGLALEVLAAFTWSAERSWTIDAEGYATISETLDALDKLAQELRR